MKRTKQPILSVLIPIKKEIRDFYNGGKIAIVELTFKKASKSSYIVRNWKELEHLKNFIIDQIRKQNELISYKIKDSSHNNISKGKK